MPLIIWTIKPTVGAKAIRNDWGNTTNLRILKKFKPNIKNIMIPQLMKFTTGSFLRMHVDNYAGEAGYTIFINDNIFL